MIGCYNRDGVCLQSGTNWIFIIRVTSPIQNVSRRENCWHKRKIHLRRQRSCVKNQRRVRLNVQERLRHRLALLLFSPSSKSQTEVSRIVTGNIYYSEN